MGLTEAGAALAGFTLGEREAAPWARYLAALDGRLDRIERKVDHVTTQQDQLNALVTQEGADLSDFAAQLPVLTEAIQAVAVELQALQNDNPGLDLSGLQVKVQALSQARAGFDAAVAAATALAPAQAPGQAPGEAPGEAPATDGEQADPPADSGSEA